MRKVEWDADREADWDDPIDVLRVIVQDRGLKEGREALDLLVTWLNIAETHNG